MLKIERDWYYNMYNISLYQYNHRVKQRELIFSMNGVYYSDISEYLNTTKIEEFDIKAFEWAFSKMAYTLAVFDSKDKLLYME